MPLCLLACGNFSYRFIPYLCCNYRIGWLSNFCFSLRGRLPRGKGKDECVRCKMVGRGRIWLSSLSTVCHAGYFCLSLLACGLVVLFPVILGNPRWPTSKMALVAVEVKSSDPRDSANAQKSQPRADLLCQIPHLCPTSPFSGLTLTGALNETSSLACKNNLVCTRKAVRCLSALSRKLLNGLLANSLVSNCWCVKAW